MPGVNNIARGGPSTRVWLGGGCARAVRHSRAGGPGI